jgi:5'-methylthioadenosine phosphorylase
MTATLGCIAGEEIYRQVAGDQLSADPLGPVETPFGPSGDIFRVSADACDYYLLARNGSGMDRKPAYRINAAANIYALKDLGCTCVMGWSAAAAITHNIAVGDLVILSDLMDLTRRQPATLFENSPLGMLRQYPVFCPHLRQQIAEIIQSMKLVYHGSAVAAVQDGPRMNTPAEVRMLTTLGAEMVTQYVAPDVFFARELQMGYVAICYATHYAETGSRHHPFTPGGLFGPPDEQAESERIRYAVGALSQITAQLAERLGKVDLDNCPCQSAQQHHIEQFNLPQDWRQWFAHR